MKQRKAQRKNPEEELAFEASDPHVYDKAKYHYDAKSFPKELPDEQAFVHTGMFVGWLVEHNMIDEEFAWDTKVFKKRKLTGTKIYESWDGCLLSDMLTDGGNRFALDYFDFDRGQYLADYEKLLVRKLPSFFHVADTWENYDILKKRIDRRYAEWMKKQAKKASRKGRKGR